MKSTVITILIFLLTFSSVQSQVIEPAINSSQHDLFEYYSLKQKKNKTTAFVLFGTGTVIAIGTLISYSNGTTDGLGGNVPTESQIAMFSIGGACALVSIPFFISANKNKRKAALHLKNSISTIKSPQNRNLNYLSASLNITF